jgi:hypothetical protein
MLPEVPTGLPIWFSSHHSSMGHSKVLYSFENPTLECYKSDLRHALNFAHIWQSAGLPGRGSRQVALGFCSVQDKEPSSNALGGGMESASATGSKLFRRTEDVRPQQSERRQKFFGDTCAETRVFLGLRAVDQRLWRKISCEPGYKMPGASAVLMF